MSSTANIRTVKPGQYKGVVAIPPSKSDSQRALLAAGLAHGTSQLHGVGDSADEQAMLGFIEAFGAKVERLEGNLLQITGSQNFPEQATFHLGESGLASRLALAICAAHPGTFTVTGTGSLLSRPMSFYAKALPRFGKQLTSKNGHLPMTLSGDMQAGKLEFLGTDGSQYLSGLLMALPLLKGDSELRVHELVSRPYVDMTLRTLQRFGIEISEPEANYFVIRGGQHYQPCQYVIESDWSSASCWLVASALGQDIRCRGLDLNSLQADRALLDAFFEANCTVNLPDGNLHIDGSKRRAFEFHATNCPDLFPALAVLAAFTPDISIINGAERLIHKESNRALSLQQELGKLGCVVRVDGDKLVIYGNEKLSGGVVDAHQDHRIAMCLAIAGMFSRDAAEIHGADSVAKSYPAFWQDLDALAVQE